MRTHFPRYFFYEYAKKVVSMPVFLSTADKKRTILHQPVDEGLSFLCQRLTPEGKIGLSAFVQGDCRTFCALIKSCDSVNPALIKEEVTFRVRSERRTA